MAGSIQSKGDGEYPYSAPFSGLNVSVPSILLPPSAQDIQTSPSFTIQRGSIAAPYPYAQSLFNFSLGTGEYLLFVTPSGYLFTNLYIYAFSNEGSPNYWQVVQQVAMPSGYFPNFPSGPTTQPIPFVEANGCIYFSCLEGIARFVEDGATVGLWSVAFYPQFMTIFEETMLCVGTYQVTQNTTPGTPTGTQSTGGSLADGTYYARVTAVFASGTEGPPSNEGSVTVSAGGGTATIDWTWTAVTGAISYNVYIGTASDEENEVFSASTNSFVLSSYTAGSVAAPVMPPLGPLVVAWSSVSDFSSTSVGDFNSNPDTSSGVYGGYDVLTSYSQGTPTGILIIGHSAYVVMTQGIVEIDPSSSGTSSFTFYNWWQENIPVGALMGSTAQWGEFGAFITPDGVVLFTPGGNQAIGLPISPYIRALLKNNSMSQPVSGAMFGETCWNLNSFFYTAYGELHYCANFYFFGIPPVQNTQPYPAVQAASWYSLFLDYNFASQSWAQMQYPPVYCPLYQVIGPPAALSPTQDGIPSQNLLIGASKPEIGNNSTQATIFCIATDVFPKALGYPSQAQSSTGQACKVGFPQTPIAAGHRPATRRVRIEYSWDELSLVTENPGVTMTVTLQGTITQNTGPINGGAVFTTTLYNENVQIILQPPGIVYPPGGTGSLVPELTCSAYADFTLSCENPQVSLSWTDPSAEQRLLIHRVSLIINDTKATMQ